MLALCAADYLNYCWRGALLRAIASELDRVQQTAEDVCAAAAALAAAFGLPATGLPRSRDAYEARVQTLLSNLPLHGYALTSTPPVRCV